MYKIEIKRRESEGKYLAHFKCTEHDVDLEDAVVPNISNLFGSKHWFVCGSVVEAIPELLEHKIEIVTNLIRARIAFLRYTRTNAIFMSSYEAKPALSIIEV